MHSEKRDNNEITTHSGFHFLLLLSLSSILIFLTCSILLPFTAYAEFRNDVAYVTPSGSQSVQIIDKGLRGIAVRIYFSDGMRDGLRKLLKDPDPTELFFDKGVTDGIRYGNLSEKTIDAIAADSLNSFMILNHNGTFQFVPELSIIKEDILDKIRTAYLEGRIIQKLGSFSEGLRVPRRFPENLHPGRTIGESYIEQLVGRIEKKDLPKKFQQFAGYVTSKLYRIDPQTGGKGKLQGYIFDVYQVRLTEKDTSTTLFVKRYLSVDGKRDNIVVTRLDTTYPYYYFIFDQMPDTKPNDIFLMTRQAGLNISYPYPIAYTLFVVDQELKFEFETKPNDSFIKKFDRYLLIVGVNLK
jgi:hypothetical protein